MAVRPPEEIDGVPFTGTLRPADAAEVAAMLADARGRGAALVACGGGSKLQWGNRSSAEKLERLDLSALDAPLEVDADEGIAQVGAGVRVADLERAARERGKRTRLPGLWADATVGGTIAADPAGPDTLADHRLRNELLGLEVALTNGELTHSGGRVVKNVTGFDLVRLYCGSLGTLGVITRATLRLWPVPESRRVRVRAHGSVAAAIGTAHAVLASGVEPAGLAVLPDPSGARLVWCIEGAQVDVDERAARIEGDPADESAWAEASRAVAGEDPAEGRCGVRVAGRCSDTGPIAEALGRRLRAALPALGIAWAELDSAALPALAERAGSSGWTLFVERAAPEWKAGSEVFAPLPDAIGLMRALKARFDPEGVLSPGRFVGRI